MNNKCFCFPVTIWGGANGIRSFNGVPLLMYWDIVKNYYINKQESKAFVIHSTPVLPLPYIDKIDWEAPWITGIGTYPEGITYPASKLLGFDTYFIVSYNNANIDWDDIMLIDMNGDGITFSQVFDVVDQDTVGFTYTLRYNVERYGTTAWQGWRYRNITDGINNKIDLYPFNITNLDEMRTKILQHPSSTPFDIFDTGIEPYVFLNGKEDGYYYRLGSQEGLAVKCYQSDRDWETRRML